MFSFGAAFLIAVYFGWAEIHGVIMKKHFAWKDGCRIDGKKFDAEKIGTHFEKLRAKAGELTAEHVLADARRRASPIHNYFEWNDEDAAQSYRRVQALELLRSVVVVYEDAPSISPVRAFVCMEPDELGSRDFIPVEAVLSNRRLRDILLDRALREAQSWRERYADLVELSKIFCAISATRRKIRAA